MKKIVLIFIVLGFISCKEEKSNSKKSNEITTKDRTVKDNIFKVIIEVKILEDDKIELYYVSEFVEGSFNADERVARYIKGSNEFQTIELTLPKDIIPYKFRIDLGDNINMNQTQVEINSINLELNGNSIFLDNTLLDRFFQPNLYLQRNESGYLRRVVDGKYDPFILSMPVLDKKIEIEL